MRSLGFVAVAAFLACGGSGCKRAAETVAEQSIKAAKETTKGLADGIQEGRKSGESLDGALVVTNAKELEGKGKVALHAVTAPDGSATTTVDLAVENLGDKPLRLTQLDFSGFDKDGFVKKPSPQQTEVTVPPHAKEKVSLVFKEKAGTVAKVRYWGVDLEVR